MIETEPTPAVKPTVDAVVEAARHRTLRLLARVSKRQGPGYNGAAMVICRTLWPNLINATTWRDVYDGTDWINEYSGWNTLAHYSQRGYADPASAETLRDEALGVTVSRETVAIAAQVDAEAPDRTCQCVEECDDPLCQGDCDPCDNHTCVQCHGEGYSCEEHSCDYCYRDHSVDTCCGWCSECGTHPEGPDDSDTCSNCGYCHECSHVCDDVE